MDPRLGRESYEHKHEDLIHQNTRRHVHILQNTCRHDYKLKSLQETIINPINHKLLEHQHKNTYSENRDSTPQIT